MTGIAYFVSDLHFGADGPTCHPDREQLFCNFLESLPGNTTHVFILGDLFEFWMEYIHYVPKHHFKVLFSLRKLVDRGINVHYFSGNHDFNLGTFFGEHLNIHIHTKPLSVSLQGKRMLLLHGDGLAASDWKYRILKKVLLHPLSNWAYKLLHPDWGMSIARWVGKTSRVNQEEYNQDEYAKAAKTLMDGHDVVMHGHIHHQFKIPLGHGLYIGIGEWVSQLNYIKMEAGAIDLCSFKPTETITSLNTSGPT